MCGRYTLFSEQDNAEIMNIVEQISRRYGENAMKTGEIYPTDRVPVMINANGKIVTELQTWGFPKFDGKGVIINARSETVNEKPLFRNSFFYRRCVIPSTGFYEWSHDSEKKKYLFNLPNKQTLYMAGIYNEFSKEKRFVILTSSANSSVSDIHNRMPVILKDSFFYDWINDKDSAAAYLKAPLPILSRTAV